MRTRFECLAQTRIALEVGGHSAWVSELLKALGHEVIVANARKLRMIFQSDSKNDRWGAVAAGALSRGVLESPTGPLRRAPVGTIQSRQAETTLWALGLDDG